MKSYAPRKSLAERLNEITKLLNEKTNFCIKDTWNVIKNRRPKETEEQYERRLKRYGYSTDGIHLRSGLCCQENNKEKTNEMDILSKLKELEGKVFKTVRGLNFTYEVIRDRALKYSRTDYLTPISDVEKAIEINPDAPGEISNTVRGSSYVFAIINDERFKAL